MIKNQNLKVKKGFLKKEIIKKLIIEIRKNLLASLIIQNILEKKMMKQINQIMINSLLLKLRKNLKIEKDLKNFHLKDIKENNPNLI